MFVIFEYVDMFDWQRIKIPPVALIVFVASGDAYQQPEV